MGNSSSLQSKDPDRYLPVERAQYLRLGLASPPENGFDDFLKLVWCRDMKYERQQLKDAEKKKKGSSAEVVVDKKYYLCIIGTYEPYGANVPPINLHKHGHKGLPKWTDEEHKEEILRNGYWFQNDAFILENYPQAIRPAEDYPYVEQYTKAYQHWNNGQKPSKDQIREHQITVAVSIMADVERLESEEGGGNDEMIRKLKDILLSMDLDAELQKECEARVQSKSGETPTKD